MKTLVRAVCGLVLCMAAGLAHAEPPPVEAYSHSPIGSGLSLSPDGTRMAYTVPVRGKPHLIIRKMLPAEGEKPVVIPSGEYHLDWFEWVNDRTLILGLSGNELARPVGAGRRIPIRYSRLVAVEADGSNLRLLYRPEFSENHFVTTTGSILQFMDDEHLLVAVPHLDEQRIGRLNVYTGKFELRERTGRTDVDYAADPRGQLRIASRYSDRNQSVVWMYRGSDKEEFREIKRSDVIEEPVFYPLGFDRNDTLYVASNHEGGPVALYTFDIATDSFKQKLLADDTFDVAGVVTYRGAVVALQYLRDMPVRRWLDPAIQSLQDSLDAAVPDSTEIVIEQSRDGRFTLVASHHPAAAPTYLLFDRETKVFGPLALTYPDIPEESVGLRQPIRYRAADGLSIPGYLTLPPDRDGRSLPLVVMPHGGPITRDSQGFDALSQFLVSRGYAVLQPNFRGSSGYGPVLEKAGHGEWGRKMQSDIADGVRWAVAQGIADPTRVCIVGWSYGGYAALMGAIADRALFKCAIAVAPVANLERLWAELDWAHFATKYNRKLFFDSSREGLQQVSPVHRAAEAGVPILLIHGRMDGVAYIEHSREMAAALKRADKAHEFIEIEEMDHSPETTEQMVTILSAWERFLAAHIGR